MAAEPYTNTAIATFRAAQQATGITTVLAHDSYLLNLAASDSVLWDNATLTVLLAFNTVDGKHLLP
jgi:endonuclease IV